MIQLFMSRSGSSVIVPLNLPASHGAMTEAYSQLEQANRTGKTEIVEIKSVIANLPSYLGGLDPDSRTQLAQLNLLSSIIAKMDSRERSIYAGALDGNSINDLNDMIRVAEQVSDYILIPNVNSDVTLGRYVAVAGQIQGDPRFPEAAWPYLDFAKIGAEYYAEHGGAYTHAGYVLLKQDAEPVREKAAKIRLDLSSSQAQASVSLPALKEELERVKKLLGIDCFAEAAITKVSFAVPNLNEYKWAQECEGRFNQLKANEEELNRIFIDIYGLQDELTPEVEDKDVTVRKADLQRDIKSLLSYAVGCMFGRYSLDSEGLAYAGEDWDESKYKTFLPDVDGIIPITDEEYLGDDIVTRLCSWLKIVYGEDTLEENVDFIAKALGGRGSSSREIIRYYFLKDFFKDHCKIYQKRPIYWLFDSGKQNGFKALIYLHRYTPDTIGNLRVDYLHKMQRVYESEIGRMQDMIDHSTNAREVAAATKRKEKLQKQLKECREYDEMIGHLALSRIELDLDDGVKVNYEKIQTASDGKKYSVLAKI